MSPRSGWVVGPTRSVRTRSSVAQPLLLAALHAGIAGGGKLILELLDAAGRVDELQFARVEGMADAADINFQFLARAPRGELIAAAAGDFGFKVFGMNSVFHGLSLIHKLEAIKHIDGGTG